MTFGLREPIVSMEYNALHWRTRRLKEDLAELCVASSPPPLLEERRYYYDAGWRLLEEHVLRCGSLSSTSQQVWGLRYIDDAVARRIDHDGNRSFTDILSANPETQPHARDRTYGYLTDHQFSVVAVVEVGEYIRLEGGGASATVVPFAEVQEWVHYDPYGFAEHRRPGDVHNDGDVTAQEATTFYWTATGWSASYYDARYDLNRDRVLGILLIHCSSYRRDGLCFRAG